MACCRITKNVLRMVVTINTKYSEIAESEQFMTDATKQQLTDAACSVFGDPWQLSIGDFVQLAGGDLSRLGEMTDPTVMQIYWINAFKAFVADFEKALQGLSMPKDAQEIAAEECLRKVSMAEGMVVFVRSYFGLHSFAEAEKVTMLDYLIAKRDAYNQAAYSKRLAQLRAAKYKKK